MKDDILPALREEHFNSAARRFAAQGYPLEVNRHAALQVLASHALAREEWAPRRGLEVAAAAISAIVTDCQKVRVANGDPRTIDFAVQVVREWLTNTPFSFECSPEVIEVLREIVERLSPGYGYDDDHEVLRHMHSIVAAAVDQGIMTQAERFTDESIFDIPDEPDDSADELLGFVAISMTNEDASVTELSTLSRMVARVALEFDIRCFEPIKADPPLIDRKSANRPELRGADGRKLRRTDVAFIIAEPAASGLGAVSELARHYGALRVVVRGLPDITPMIAGAEPSPAILSLGPDLENDLREFLRTNIQRIRTLHDRRRRRAQRARIWHERLIDTLGQMSEEELILPWAPVDIDAVRFHALLADPSLVLDLTWAETLSLHQFVVARPTALSVDEYRAAFEAEANGWIPAEEMQGVIDDAIAALDLESAQRDLAMEHRTKLSSPIAWKRFYDSRSTQR